MPNQTATATAATDIQEDDHEKPKAGGQELMATLRLVPVRVLVTDEVGTLPNQTAPVATATDIPTTGAVVSVADESAVITSLDISSDSLAAVGLRNLGRQQKEILDLVIGAMRNGADDMTRAEIKESYQRIYGKAIESGTVSARVAGLKDAGRLLQREQPRQCRVTGKTKTVVYAPEKQSSLL